MIEISINTSTLGGGPGDFETRKYFEIDDVPEKPSPLAAKCTTCKTKYKFYINFSHIAAPGSKGRSLRKLIESNPILIGNGKAFTLGC